VRLRYAYVIRCDEVVEDAAGNVVELRCSYDPETRGGNAPGRKGLGTIHWVSARHALDAEVRLYDRLFDAPDPTDVPEGGVFLDHLNPDSLRVVRGAKVEPSVAHDTSDTRYQFERTGYFWRDPADGVGEALVFNRIITLKDTWANQEAPAAPRAPISPPDSHGPAPLERPRVSEERTDARRRDPVLAARMERYTRELDLTLEDADVLTGSLASADFFEAALAEHGDALAVASWMVNDLRGVLGGRELAELPFDGAGLGRLAALVAHGRLSRRAAKEVLAEMAAKGGDPADIAERLGLDKVVDTDALTEVVDKVLTAWPEKVAEFREGRRNLLGLFVGEVMKATGGAADPKAVKAILTERLGGSR
jgi:glutaminyl-tRNA synthetase